MSLAAHLTFAMTVPHPRDDREDLEKSGVPSSQGPDRNSWQRGFANAWMVLGAAPAGLLIGYVIDRAAGTAPWWMLGLSLLFLAVSLYQLVKDSLK